MTDLDGRPPPPTTASSTSLPPPPGRPYPPYPPPGPRKKKRWPWIVGILVGVPVVLLIIAVLVAALWIRSKNEPAEVPDDWTVPEALPQGATPIAEGRVAFASDRSGTLEIYTMNPDGSDVVQLTDDPEWDAFWPRMDPSRRTVLFYRTPAGTADNPFDEAFKKANLWVVGSDGADEVLLRPAGLDGWALQGHAEWSPDGDRLVMSGGSATNPQIQITDPLGQNPRQVTDRGGTNIDPSWSPDGSTIVFVGCPSNFCLYPDYEIYTIDAAAEKASEATRLTNDSIRDHDPYYSPDGEQLAWLSCFGDCVVTLDTWDIRIGNSDATDVRRLVGDEFVSSYPAWSSDGSTIFFHRIGPGDGDDFQIYRINPDGSGMERLTDPADGINEYPGT